MPVVSRGGQQKAWIVDALQRCDFGVMVPDDAPPPRGGTRRRRGGFTARAPGAVDRPRDAGVTRDQISQRTSMNPNTRRTTNATATASKYRSIRDLIGGP